MCARWNKENANNQYGIFTFYSWSLNMEVFEYYKSFEHKISKGKHTRFFLRLAGIAVGYFNRKV